MSFAEDNTQPPTADRPQAVDVEHDTIAPTGTELSATHIGNCCNRVMVVIIGLFLGLLTVLPNVMISDSGTTRAISASYIGLLASASMILGGFVGAVRGYPWAGWFWLLPGVALQIIAFLVLSSLANRVAVACIGLLLGLLTFFPNMMMSDSGTTRAISASYIGLLASASMILGGIVGAVRGSPWAGWCWLIPGVALQIIMFLVAFYRQRAQAHAAHSLSSHNQWS
jgi:hypothetical protein